MIHTILFTRDGEPDTNAILTLSSDVVSAEESWLKFHGAVHKWLTSTMAGKALQDATCGDFNIGDLACNDTTIINDDEFQSILDEAGMSVERIEFADHRVPYDRVLCSKPKP